MPLEIQIDENKISDLSNDAKNKLIDETENYIEDLLAEARLIEESLRERNAGKEITSSHIIQAARKGKNRFTKRKPWYVKASKWVSPISSMFVGITFQPGSWDSAAWKPYVFATVLFIAIGSTILQYFKDGD